MSVGCGSCGTAKFDGTSAAYRRILWTVVAINVAMFLVEMVAGALAGSQALHADALDFLGDSVTYGLSLWAIGKPPAWRARTAMVKGFSLAAFAAWVLGSTIYQMFVMTTPEPQLMGGVAALAFGANLLSVLLLMRYRNGDANVRSVWLCSRNDMIGNVAVAVAALGVWGTASGWPDLIVAGIMAALFLSSAVQIIRQARGELRAPRHAHAH